MSSDSRDTQHLCEITTTTMILRFEQIEYNNTVKKKFFKNLVSSTGLTENSMRNSVLAPYPWAPPKTLRVLRHLLDF